MALKPAIVTISAKNRDHGKVFLITEMPAFQLERWATRALLAAIKGGAEIPEGIEKQGLAGVVYLGLRELSKMDYEAAAPLLAEMLTCVRIQPDPKKPDYTRADIENDIEEISTIITLRMAIFELHAGFSLPAVFSK